MKITILAAVAAATLATSFTTAVPASARQHCFTTSKQVCRPTQHGTTVCRTFRERRCVSSFNHLKKPDSLEDRFVNRSRKSRGRRR